MVYQLSNVHIVLILTINFQVVYHVTNNYSHQRTIHAPLRAKRPGIDSHEGALV